MSSNDEKHRIYYKGKAFSELLLLILVSIIFSFFSATLILISVYIYALSQVGLNCFMIYRIYYWAIKSKSNRVGLYMFPIVGAFVLSLPNTYFSVTNPFEAILFAINYPFVRILQSIFSLGAIIMYVVGYLSLKSTLSNANIKIGFLGPDKTELEQFNPHTE